MSMKPGVLERTLKAPQHDQKNRYDQELAARGIDRGSSLYRNNFEYALLWLRQNRPFYNHMFADVIRRETFDVDTLAVRIAQARIEMMYNPDFVSLHTVKENVGFIQHEMGHVIHNHLPLKKKMSIAQALDPATNLALDLAVDTLIQGEGEQPEWVILPGDLVDENGDTALERKSWAYYKRLLRDHDQNLDKVRLRPGNGEGQRLTMDDHGTWTQEGTDPATAQAEVIRQTVSFAFSRARGQEHKSPMRGYMSGELIKYIEDLLREKSVPFERLFRSIIGSHIKIGRKPTMLRLSRRRGVPPGTKMERRLHVLWAQDDSGSMNDDEVALCRSEMVHAHRMNGVKVDFQRFCHGLVGPLLDLDVVNFKEAMTRASGGTDFDAVIDQAHEMRPDLLIIGTDGGAPTPRRRPPCPCVWILTNGGRSHPWGTVVRLPTREEIKTGYRAVIERWGH